MNPFVVGKAYFIETLTLYYVGEVIESHPTYIKMKNASWVHWTGRKSVTMAHKSFSKKKFGTGDTKPRTEFVGEYNLSLAGVNAWTEWPVENLPLESIQ